MPRTVKIDGVSRVLNSDTRGHYYKIRQNSRDGSYKYKKVYVQTSKKSGRSRASSRGRSRASSRRSYYDGKDFIDGASRTIYTDSLSGRSFYNKRSASGLRRVYLDSPRQKRTSYVKVGNFYEYMPYSRKRGTSRLKKGRDCHNRSDEITCGGNPNCEWRSSTKSCHKKYGVRDKRVVYEGPMLPDDY